MEQAKRLEQQFLRAVAAHAFPAPISMTSASDAKLKRHDLLELFDSQVISRCLDFLARDLRGQNKSFYTIGSSGHEGMAAVARAFQLKDHAFLHYRDAAFMLERARQQPDFNAIEAIILSLMAAKDDPIAAGRHKVLGSKALNIPPQTSTIASHLPKAVGAAMSIRRAAELQFAHPIADESVVLCSFGDASSNHASALTAFNSVEWMQQGNYPLPLVFICEDNGLGISVPTPDNWIKTQFSDRKYLHYIAADGLNLCDVYTAAKQAEKIARSQHKPVFLHIKCVRLLGHAGTDIEAQYSTADDIKAREAQDPLLHTARILLEEKLLETEQIISRYLVCKETVLEQAERLSSATPLQDAATVMQSILPAKPIRSQKLPIAKPTVRKKIFADQEAFITSPRNMAQNINYALRDLMLQYPQIITFGEDVGKKGGVYRVTAELQKLFGQRRVFDSLLDETSILGAAIGLAHNNFIPIPEIQFLAYLHNAEDQIRGEAATLSFFSNQQYANPMVIRIPGLAYQKGFGGHFHNENSFAVLRDIPGLIIACPSNGADAARMLRTCMAKAYYENRVCIFLEPIALYMTKDLHEKDDNLWLSIYPEPNEKLELDEINIVGEGKDCLVLSYGNGYYLSCQAKQQLQTQGVNCTVADIRWLAPLPETPILQLARQFSRLVIVDECRQTGSISEALVTLLVEKCQPLPAIQRVAAKDSFITLGDTWQYLLLSVEDIVEAVISSGQAAG